MTERKAMRGGRALATAALAALIFLAAGGGRLRAVLAQDAPSLPSGPDLSAMAVAETRTAASLESMMGEGRFSKILYLYDIVLSPDSRWLTYILDAIPAERGGHHYYVYMMDLESTERELVLETKTGPALSASFAWLGADTPALFWPEYPEDVSRAESTDGPPWERCLRVRGQDPRVQPNGGGIAFRRLESPEATSAALWHLSLQEGAVPQTLSSHGSVFGPMEWAPDGSRLAFLSPEQAEFGEALWTVAPGETPTLVSSLPAVDFHWSPTSDMIAIRTQEEELVVLTVPGGEPLGRAAATRNAVWSPDGSGLAFVAYDEASALETVDYLPARGGARRRLLASKSAGGWDFGVPFFTVDGAVLYAPGAAGKDVTGDGQALDQSDRSLYRCDIGNDAVTVVEVAGSAVRPVLSRDGRSAVMVVESTEGSLLWGLDLATGRAFPWGRLPVAQYAYELAWSDDGRRVAYEDSNSLCLATLAPAAPSDG